MHKSKNYKEFAIERDLQYVISFDTFVHFINMGLLFCLRLTVKFLSKHIYIYVYISHAVLSTIIIPSGQSVNKKHYKKFKFCFFIVAKRSDVFFYTSDRISLLLRLCKLCNPTITIRCYSIPNTFVVRTVYNNAYRFIVKHVIKKACEGRGASSPK